VSTEGGYPVQAEDGSIHEVQTHLGDDGEVYAGELPDNEFGTVVSPVQDDPALAPPDMSEAEAVLQQQLAAEGYGYEDEYGYEPDEYEYDEPEYGYEDPYAAAVDDAVGEWAPAVYEAAGYGGLTGGYEPRTPADTVIENAVTPQDEAALAELIDARPNIASAAAIQAIGPVLEAIGQEHGDAAMYDPATVEAVYEYLGGDEAFGGPAGQERAVEGILNAGPQPSAFTS
jgi:hypothetical protein